MEWEYKILEVEPEKRGSDITLNYEKLEIQLNVLGKSGWELVETSPTIATGFGNNTHTFRLYLIFKREIKER